MTEQSDEHAATRAAFDAWGKSSPADAEEFALPPPRPAFPPSFLILLAAACAVLAAEPTADLEYEALGPSATVDLGKPGAYGIDTAKDGSRVRITGYLGSTRGNFSRYGDKYEVAPLIGIPVLVRRAPHPAAKPDTAELYTGEGRLVRLPDSGSSYFERLFDPSSRYATVRLQFQALGELPFGQPAWLLLEGDLPRADRWAIAVPILLWVAAVAFLWLAWKSYRGRKRAAELRKQMWRTT